MFSGVREDSAQRPGFRARTGKYCPKERLNMQIDEFVRCKAGEMERRLSACQRTVKNLSKEQGKDEGDAKQSSLKRVFKIEAEIDR